MSDIFNEVEEELRRDKYNTLLRRYGLWVAGAALIIVLVVAGYELAWQPWQEARRGEAAENYAAAVKEAKAGDVTALEAVAAGSHEGYAALALMRLGAVTMNEGDSVRAASYYQEAAEKAGGDSLSGLAQMRALYALSETLSFGELLERAEPLAQEANPYRFSARELIGLGALRAGDLERARSEFEYLILAPQTPPGVRRRAEEALAAVKRASASEAPADSPAPAPNSTKTDAEPASNPPGATGAGESEASSAAETPPAEEDES